MMKKRVFEIIKNGKEVDYENRNRIKPGVTTMDNNQNPETVEVFDVLEDAKKALSKYRTTINLFPGIVGRYYLVEEFYIEENYYDEDGEWIDGGDIHEFSIIQIEVESDSHGLIGVYDNLEEAEEAYHECDEDDVHIWLP